MNGWDQPCDSVKKQTKVQFSVLIFHCAICDLSKKTCCIDVLSYVIRLYSPQHIHSACIAPIGDLAAQFVGKICSHVQLSRLMQPPKSLHRLEPLGSN